MPESAFEAFLYTQKKVTELFTLKSKSRYNITSAIAHKLLYGLRGRTVDTPILFYSSVNGDKDDYCLAIHPSLIDDPKRFQFKTVLKCILKKDGKADVLLRGKEANGNIAWSKMKIILNWVDRNSVLMITDNGTKSIVTNQSYLYANGIKENVLLLLDKNFGGKFEQFVLEEMNVGGEVYEILKQDKILKTEYIHCPIKRGILKVENKEDVIGFKIRISYSVAWV